jgi:dTDP-4-dehydrorhamnose 3,5-epimerase
MSFIFQKQVIPDVVLVRRPSFHDDRGSFAEAYKRSTFHAAGIVEEFVQDNLVVSERNVLRGLHYQLPPFAQGKLVGVTRGEIFDVAVDLRRQEGTYGRWVSATLTENGEMLWVPAGFAHGYLVISESADVTYKVTSEYEPASDRGIRWDDPTVGVRWPVSEPILSVKDQALPTLSDADSPF